MRRVSHASSAYTAMQSFMCQLPQIHDAKGWNLKGSMELDCSVRVWSICAAADQHLELALQTAVVEGERHVIRVHGDEHAFDRRRPIRRHPRRARTATAYW